MFREMISQPKEPSTTGKSNLWGIVLAGGEGTRLKNLVKRLYGYHRPKQYCTLTGVHSLIRQTISRASKIIPDNKILTVVTSHHSEYFREELSDQQEGNVIVQPCPRDTSAGVLLPVAKIYQSDPESTVIIFPSDHFIQEETKFINHVKEACTFVERNPGLIVMVGVRPEKIETGLGWMERGEKIHSFNDLNFHQVRKFWEKPDLKSTASLYASGCLVNTFIVIGKSKTIINQMRKHLPDLYEAFTPIMKSLGTKYEKIFIEQFFEFMPEVNFSKNFLEKINEHLAVLEVPNVYWSDWGEEERVTHDMKRFHLSFSHKIYQRKKTERLYRLTARHLSCNSI
ncbi:MAG: sugar phosphate nucleotidyltransferase [Ignavibacteriaceae bacterium]|jgi:mannose-1-phosphate guanylyltransferase